MTVGVAVPFVDLRALHAPLEAELEAAACEVIRSTAYAQGPEATAFESEWAAYCGAPHAVGVQSGTAALMAALRAVGAGPGTEVVAPTNTFVATVGAIHAVGARPVLVDVDPLTLLLGREQVESAVTDRTRAIVPVHLYGQVADVAGLRDLVGDRPIAIVEDACQAHGARSGNVRAGALGAAGCFSFYPSKNLGAVGEAGIVLTHDEARADAMRRYRNHGGIARYEHAEPGLNLRLPSLQAAALRCKLPHLDRWNHRRREIAEQYTKAFADLPLKAPATRAGADHVFHLYVVQVDRRDEFLEFMSKRNIATGIHYPDPIHLLPAYAHLGHRAGAFPVAEAAATRIVSLPMFPTLTEEQVQWVITSVQAFHTS